MNLFHKLIEKWHSMRNVTSLLGIYIETEAVSQLNFCPTIELVTDTLQPPYDAIRIFKQIIIN